jgi:hypothetical protein
LSKATMEESKMLIGMACRGAGCSKRFWQYATRKLGNKDAKRGTCRFVRLHAFLFCGSFVCQQGHFSSGNRLCCRLYVRKIAATPSSPFLNLVSIVSFSVHESSLFTEAHRGLNGKATKSPLTEGTQNPHQ